jgi:hypothetical protein
VKELEAGRSEIFVYEIEDHTRQPFVVDPDRFCRRVGENIAKRKIAILPENSAEAKIAPQVIISQIS